MTTELVHGRVWARLRKARAKSKHRARVAVAYVGKGAARLLGLGSGSWLVVDASEHAVKSGQTCPVDLLALLDRGVRVFNCPGLHAKVYVFGKAAAIGSANASRHSADVLLEAMVVTTDATMVSEARRFVEGIAKDELGPESLKHLAKLYRPPRLPSDVAAGNRRRKGSRAGSPPRIRLVQLTPVELSDRDAAEHGTGEKVARRHREHRRWRMDDFQWIGAQTFRKGDKVMMVTKEDSGQRLVDPPGSVLHVRKYSYRNGTAAFVYVELPARRRRNVRSLARHLGTGSLRRLQRGGTLTSNMSEALYDLWQT